METEYIEAINPNGTRLRLEFGWQSDRYAQRISLINDNGAACSLLESIEGSTSDDWPPSPPLQTLSIETRGDGHHVALLLGMAGSSHWSASIEAAPKEAQIIFDIACRHGATPGPLGSRYRRLTDSGEKIAIIGEFSNVCQDEKQIAIRPVDDAVESGTTRWRFKVAIR